jgi:hypothetical protein
MVIKSVSFLTAFRREAHANDKKGARLGTESAPPLGEAPLPVNAPAADFVPFARLETAARHS